MIAHTRQFPTRPNITNMESTVVIATPAEPDMMEDCQRTCRMFLNKNKIRMRSMINSCSMYVKLLFFFCKKILAIHINSSFKGTIDLEIFTATNLV